ncbi:WbuC family cupin fold metalloprotein [Plebeiibacterium marinum]|uniref:WbuC family cupin fold metalloprotein n=1 Tax=Plebeiibacterium marinum TaxID=2992111 RepID=A0AAE3MGR9_9BACT|nr:WbuC family cupin fold metalloprotein [Plebeiobacterium marinum]MCW3807284.1 WbuC family cupin fold metalloprotein [Plebeiobacterium marinum]
MIVINKSVIEQLISDARQADRKRKNLNFHKYKEDPLQRMLNAFEPGTYVHPHTHENPDKREVFLVLTGKLLVIFFNEKGDVVEHVVLDRDKGFFAVEINPGECHTVTGLETGTVAYEIKDGPYDVSDDKNFADWAPEEGSAEADNQLKQWINKLGFSLNC